MANRSGSRTSLVEVLREELQAIRGWEGLPPPPSSPFDTSALKAIYRFVADRAGSEAPLSALCLSGGGIRSATFNLGVLQALARAGVLPGFDYLSTVSGGGYVGAWLQAWIAREREKGEADPVHKVAEALCRPGRTPAEAAARAGGAVDDPLDPEPNPVDRTREFSNYLTPRKGLFSGDTWAVAAIVLRNLLLNWLVLLPVIAAVLMIPQAAYVITASRAYGTIVGEPWTSAAGWAAMGVGLVSSVATNWMRTERRGRPLSGDEAERRRERRRRQVRRRTFVVASAGGLFAACALLVLAATWARSPWEVFPGLGILSPPATTWDRAVRVAVWTAGLPLAGCLAVRAGRLVASGQRPRLAALAIEAVAIALPGGLVALLLAWILGDPWSALLAQPIVTTVLALPALLVVYVLARALYVALVSRVEDWGLGEIGDDAEREWWARITGRLLMAGAGWAALSGLALAGTYLLADGWRDETLEMLHRVAGWVAAVGGFAGAVAAFLGRSGETSSGRPGAGDGSARKELLLRLAAPITVACVLALVAAGSAWLGRAVVPSACFLLVPPLPDCTGAVPLRAQLLSFLGVGAALAAVGGVAGWFVNVNRFSLHAMYRNRLVRAYLGASNPDRRPNAITGFDPDDARLRLSELRPPQGERARLFPIVNVTLDLLRDERLAIQERQAESFSMTPLFCGNFYEGYRRTEEYGGRGGVSLASAMAVSGAAANPNMGYLSSPALTALMALLNARLGIWLANPNEYGDRVARRPGPGHATWHLLREMAGATTRYSAYVNLSDGGHFDNLGLYEVVLRRCRLVVVSDAGDDPGFGDLGKAIRKIRVDFGIPVRFEKEIEIRPRGEKGELPERGLYCAVGTIDYGVADGASAPPGTLVYLKPTLAPNGGKPSFRETLPYDVLSYAAASPAFPLESTIDQWFSESQFESYRALGAHLVGAIAGTEPLADPAAFVERARQHAGVPAGAAGAGAGSAGAAGGSR